MASHGRQRAAISALYQSMKHLWEDGKSLYKTSNKTKLKDYTLRNIRQQVRKEQGDGSDDAKAAPFDGS
jgi:hypothetical protein